MKDQSGLKFGIEEITQKIKEEYPLISHVLDETAKVMVGQQDMIKKLLIGILTDGHILIEGVPGLAKTTAIKTLSAALDASFHRIQFTPDLLPADLIGTQIYNPKEGSFSVKKGPLFAHIILADEINRAPAKVQSALLEAMQEKQVTIGEQSFELPMPFLVMATQNPVEQEGTYPLPEAQVDRFMLKVSVAYPSKEEEMEIMKRMARCHQSGTAGVGESVSIGKVLSPEKVLELRTLIDSIFVDNKIYDYVANIVFATRTPAKFGLKDLEGMIEYGASPRASINLIKAAKAHAFLQGRAFVTPQDIKSIGLDVLRHRIMTSYEAQARELSSDEIVMRILDKVDVP